MANMKPNFDGKGMYSDFYDGPPPTPGPYRGEIKGMWASTVQSGDNEGADKILVSVEINHGKFKGARLLTNLTLLKSSAWTINQFLHALTPAGTQKQKDIMEALFWDKGYKTDPDNDHKLGTPIVNIGGKFKPIGKEVGFITKFDTYNGEKRAIVDRFVVPLENSGDDEPATTEETVEESESGSGSDTLVDFPDQDGDSTETVEASADDDADDDDPWGE